MIINLFLQLERTSAAAYAAIIINGCIGIIMSIARGAVVQCVNTQRSYKQRKDL
jgi:hypothetical protein